MNKPTPKQLDLEESIKEIEQEEHLKKVIEDHNNNPMLLDTTPYKLTELIAFKLSKDDLELINAEAKERGMTMSKLIRYCLMSEGVIYSFD